MSDKIRFLEEVAANGHVALNVMQYDGWLLRFSNGYTSRANSVCVLYPSSKPLEEKIEYCEKCYEKQGQPTIFKLTDADTELSELLTKRGYETVTPTDVMEVSIEGAGLSELGNNESVKCLYAAEPEEWLPRYFAFENIADEWKRNTFREMLSKVMIDVSYGMLYYEGEPVACASIAVEHGYALLQNVVVTSSMRGRGLGEKLCRAMIAKAGEMGAEHVFLQVVQTNQAAMNLYRKLGFRKDYAYWYMRKSISAQSQASVPPAPLWIVR